MLEIAGGIVIAALILFVGIPLLIAVGLFALGATAKLFNELMTIKWNVLPANPTWRDRLMNGVIQVVVLATVAGLVMVASQLK